MKTFHVGAVGVVINIFIYNWFAVAVVDAKPFTLYWNIPSFMCGQFKLPPINVTEKYGILQNEDDAFRTQWIYDTSDVIYPSIYMTEQIRPGDRVPMVRGRVRESIRLSRRARGPQKPQVIAYFRYVFTDTKKFLSEKDTFEAINTVRNVGGDGVVLWGSSFDLNTKPKCVQFYKYLETVFGPIAQSFQPRYTVNGVDER